MTTTQPANPAPIFVPVPFDHEAWIAEDTQRRVAFAVQLAISKASLFDALASAGIVSVTVGFDGYGDNGQIEETVAFDAHGVVDLPDLTIAPVQSGAGSETVQRDAQPVNEVLEALAYDLLESEHGGWENNDGAFGEFAFDVATRTITLEYSQRFTATEYSETSW